MKASSKLFLSSFFILLFGATMAYAAADDLYSIGAASGGSLTYELQPGGSLRDAVIVENLSPRVALYNVHAVDKQEPLPEDPPGAFALVSDDREMKTIGKWITMDKTQVTVQPGGKEKVFFTLQIPTNIEKMEYGGGMVASLISTQEPPSPTSTKAPGSKETVNVIAIGTRVGVRVLLTITDTPQENKNLAKEGVEAMSAESEDEVLTESATAEESAEAEKMAEKSDEEGVLGTVASVFTPLNILLGIIFLALLAYVLKSFVLKKK